MRLILIFLSVLMLTFTNVAFCDLVSENPQWVCFKITNLKDFKGFTFTVKYSEIGERFTLIEKEAEVKEGVNCPPGTGKLTAKDSKGKVYVSNLTISSKDKYSTDADKKTLELKIEYIKDGVIKFVGHDLEEKDSLPLVVPSSNQPNNWNWVILTVIALTALLFMIRKQKKLSYA